MDVLMAIVDFIPVGLFLAASILLQRDLYNKMSKGTFALFATGTITVFTAGVLKAFYKLLGYGFNVNWDALNKCFFPMQTIGFIIAGAGMIALMIYRQGEGKAYSITFPIVAMGVLAAFQEQPEFKGTIIFVALMIVSVAALDGSLMYVAVKRKSIPAFICLIVAFVGTLAMGYLSTKESLSDWYKEIVNTIAQGSLLAAAILLRKNGLGDPHSLDRIVKHG